MFEIEVLDEVCLGGLLEIQNPKVQDGAGVASPYNVPSNVGLSDAQARERVYWGLRCDGHGDR